MGVAVTFAAAAVARAPAKVTTTIRREYVTMLSDPTAGRACAAASCVVRLLQRRRAAERTPGRRTKIHTAAVPIVL